MSVNTDAIRMELIASLIQDTLKQKAIIFNSVANYSQLVAKGLKSVSIPLRNQFAAADKTAGTDLVAQTMTFGVDKIELNKHKAIYCTLERIADVQATVEIDSQILQEMINELALQIDKDLYTQLKLASASAPDHRIAYASTNIGKTDILEARRLLNIQSVPMEDRQLLINPDSEKAMLAIDDFVHVDKYGATATGLINGEIGRVYGFKVLMSNVVETLGTIAYHKSAVGFAMQLNPEYDTDKNLKAVSNEYLLHQIYGCKVLDSGKRQVLLGTAA